MTSERPTEAFVWCWLPARMTAAERAFFWRRQFLNPYATAGYASRRG